MPSSLRAVAPKELQGELACVPQVTRVEPPMSNCVLRSSVGPRSLYGDHLRSSVPTRVGVKENTYLIEQSFTTDDELEEFGIARNPLVNSEDPEFIYFSFLFINGRISVKTVMYLTAFWHS